MVYTVNRASAEHWPRSHAQPRIAAMGLSSRAAGTRRPTERRATSRTSGARPRRGSDVILQGPHIHVASPFYKTPNETMAPSTWTGRRWIWKRSPPDAIPVTSYKPRGSAAVYDAAYTHWGLDKPSSRSRSLSRRVAGDGGQHRRAHVDPGNHPAGRSAHPRRVLALGLPIGRPAIWQSFRPSLASLVSDFLDPRGSEERHLPAVVRAARDRRSGPPADA